MAISIAPRHIGVAASLLCAVHCAATPLAVGLFSAVGASWIRSPWVEVPLLAVAAVSVALTLGRDVRRHRQWGPLAAGISGLLVLATGDLFAWPPAPAGVLAAVLLSGAQLTNHRLHRCGSDCGNGGDDRTCCPTG